jgi:hypothetical protein
MSYIPLPNPHPSQFPIPFTPVRDVRQDLWNYRLLRSLQVNITTDQLVHCPYYRPFSSLDAGFTSPPFLIGGDHHFEWRSSSHHQPILTLLISIHPGYQFSTPQVIISNSLTHACPSIHLLHWDCPIELPNKVREFIQELDDALEEDLYKFLDCIDSWFQLYWESITPNEYYPPTLTPTHPPLLPITPANPFTIPLVFQQ